MRRVVERHAELGTCRGEWVESQAIVELTVVATGLVDDPQAFWDEMRIAKFITRCYEI
jgi:hypothetical protein